MRTPTQKRFIFIFALIVLVELLSANISALNMLHYLAKPAIVISLIIFFSITSKQLFKPLRRLTISALVFCVLGDILLMFVDSSPHFFTVGLVAFLLAHLLYAMVFFKQRNSDMKPIGFGVIALVYAFGLFYMLNDGLGAMRIPVIIYMIVILIMATSAFIRKGAVSHHSFILVFVGALCFMLSDSILALNKFYAPIPLSNISIMLTYALAQLLIVLGILKSAVTNPTE